MASLQTKFIVGAFVATGIGIAIAAVFWLGVSNYLEKGNYYAAYFDESVQGLEKDSPVKYRGVTIGRVHRIGVAPDATLIETILKIETGLKAEKYGKDMVAQLKYVGITGILFIEIDRKHSGEPDFSPKLSFKPEYPVVATRPSEIKKFLRQTDDVLAQFRAIDFKSLADSLQSTMIALRQSVDDAQLRTIAEDIHKSVQSAQKILDPARWQAVLDSFEEAGQSVAAMARDADQAVLDAKAGMERMRLALSENKQTMDEILSDLHRAAGKVNGVMQNGDDFIAGIEDKISRLERHMTATFQNMEKTTEHLTRLTERLEDSPSQIFWGKPARDRKIEPGTN
jgi:phospholipid/cholesterol/gamma-HCH transport system substrate-binding protein